MAILTYHHIGDCPPEQKDHSSLWVPAPLFAAQLAWLRDHGYESITLNQMHACLLGKLPLPKRWIAITFDDGWRDNYMTALPILKEHGFSATVFAVTGRLRTGPPADTWNEYLSAEEAREMLAQGLCVGSHTRTHPRLTSLQGDALTEEIAGSRQDLEKACGTAPEWFCYPFGNFSRRIIESVRQAGYIGALSTVRGNCPKPHQLFCLPRVMITGQTRPARLGYMLSWAYNLVHAAKNRRRWKLPK